MALINYLAIGHVAADQTPAGIRLGGTVSFASRTAGALGCRAAVVTSAAPDITLAEQLPDVAVQVVAAAETTAFTNQYTTGGREQTLHGRAAPLTADAVPAAWRRAAIVHLAPIAAEVDPAMIQLFSNSLVGVTPQGWLRGWDENGRVFARSWPQAQRILPLAAAVILSEEDLPDAATLAQYRWWANLLVLTQGAAGCTIFWRDQQRQIATPAVAEVNPTGAGDIFAAAFLVRLQQTGGDAWAAARFANRLAAESVTQDGLAAKVAHIEQCYREMMDLV